MYRKNKYKNVLSTIANSQRMPTLEEIYNSPLKSNSIEKGVEEHKVGDIKGPEEDFQVEPSRKEGDRERTRVDRWREEAKKPIPIR